MTPITQTLDDLIQGWRDEINENLRFDVVPWQEGDADVPRGLNGGKYLSLLTRRISPTVVAEDWIPTTLTGRYVYQHYDLDFPWRVTLLHVKDNQASYEVEERV